MTVALTFDDGPDPVWTPRVLAALATAGARATFFVMGARAARHPDVVRAVLAAGHDVQLHCHHHVRHTLLDRAALDADTDRALATLLPLGVRPTRWRVPWGVLGRDTEAVADERGLELVHWSADTEDWDGAPAATQLTRIADALRPGAIVLAHDGVGPGALRDGCAETVALIAPLVAAVRALGLDPGPLPPPPPLSAHEPRTGRSPWALGASFSAWLGAVPGARAC